MFQHELDWLNFCFVFLRQALTLLSTLAWNLSKGPGWPWICRNPLILASLLVGSQVCPFVPSFGGLLFVCVVCARVVQVCACVSRSEVDGWVSSWIASYLIIFYICVHVCMYVCHGAQVEVRGQFVGVCSFLPYGSGARSSALVASSLIHRVTILLGLHLIC